MAKPERRHVLTVSVTFDKPITKAQARKEFRDLVHGEFYPGGFSDAELMKIRGVGPGPKLKKYWER